MYLQNIHLRIDLHFRAKKSYYDKKLSRYILERTSNSKSLFYKAYKSIWLNQYMLWMTADLSLDNIYILFVSIQVFATPPWQLTSEWLIFFLPLAICIVYITNFSSFPEIKYLGNRYVSKFYILKSVPHLHTRILERTLNPSPYPFIKYVEFANCMQIYQKVVS